MVRFHQLEVVRRLPHPGRGFTQGLIVAGDTVWESTGLYGESALLRYQLGDAQAAACAALAPELFGEGICRAGTELWQLTYQEKVALRWDPQTLTRLGTVPYNREGWGICAVDGQVVTSDGTSELIRRDPRTLQPQDQIAVRCAGRRVTLLNDLDWAAGRIWANILGRPCLAGIDPDSGEVTDIVDARGIRERHLSPQAVLNGITALPEPGEFLLTGKYWRRLYHVRLAPGRHSRPEWLLG